MRELIPQEIIAMERRIIIDRIHQPEWVIEAFSEMTEENWQEMTRALSSDKNENELIGEIVTEAVWLYCRPKWNEARDKVLQNKEFGEGGPVRGY